MKLIALVTIIMVFALTLTACSKPTVDSPDTESYGKTIKPDHNVPEADRDQFDLILWSQPLNREISHGFEARNAEILINLFNGRFYKR